jgi:hypothetical protein
MKPDGKWTLLKNRLDSLSHDDIPEIYYLFRKQTNLFLAALEEIQPPIRLVVDGRNARPDNPGNWFTVISPVSWGRKVSSLSSGPGSGYGSGVGIGYAFYYAKSNNGDHYVRLSSSVENPFKKEFREIFKNDISMAVTSQNTPIPKGYRVWPNTMFDDFRFHGTALIECQPVLLGDNTWNDVLQYYLILNKTYNNVVAQLIRKYHEKGAFSVGLDFDY